MNEPSQAIIMPTRDRLLLLKRAVESVVSQTYSNWRLIIVNDGSTDGTQAYLEDLAKHDARIEVLHFKTSRGVNAARNAAFDVMDGSEFASCLDDDDYFVPGALEVMATEFRALPNNVGGAFFNTYNISPTSRRVQGFKFMPDQSYSDLTYMEAMTKSRFSGDCHPVFRASLFYGGAKAPYRYPEDINGFETELLMRMVRDGVIIRFFPEVVACKDHSHDQPHLSEYAARRDPASFVRANLRIFPDHEGFFSENPKLASARALGAIKVAIRANDMPHALLFGWYYVRSIFKSVRTFSKAA